MAYGFDDNKNKANIPDIRAFTITIDNRSTAIGYPASANVQIPAEWDGANVHVLGISFKSSTAGIVRQEFAASTDYAFDYIVYSNIIRVQMRRTNENAGIYTVYVVAAEIES